MTSQETELIRDLLKVTDRELIKYLFNLDQSFNTNEIEHLLDGRNKELQAFTRVFPELVAVYTALELRSNYLSLNPSAIINWLSYNKKTQELIDHDKAIKQAYQKLRKRIKQAKTIAQNIGLDLFEKGIPNLRSFHYEVACHAAQILCSKWFINKVYLFGSVSRGNERPDSDIDLAICKVPKRNSSSIERIIKDSIVSLHEQKHKLIPEALCNRTKTMFDLVSYSKKLISSGHLKEAILLAENDKFEVNIRREKYTFKKTSLIKEYSFSESMRTRVMQSLVYPIDGERYHNILIEDDLPVSYRIIFFEIDEVGYIRPRTLNFECIRKYESSDALYCANHLLFKALQPMQPKQTDPVD